MRHRLLSKSLLSQIVFRYLSIIAFAASFGTQANAGLIDTIGAEVQEVFDKSAPSVVKVRALGGSAPLASTGFFIDNQGTILASYAGIVGARKAWVQYQDQKIEAKILGSDPRSGVAVLKIEQQETPALPLGDSDTIQLASAVIGVAYPYNLPLSPTFGIVTGFDIRYLNYFFCTTHFRAGLKLKPGQIGGPVLNSNGEVMGMLALAIQDGAECYAIPIKSAMKIVQDIKQNGKAHHAWAGVGVSEGRPSDNGKKPVIISQLYQETPAIHSGLEPGDVLIKIGDRVIKHPSDVLDAAFFSYVGEKLPVLVKRGDQDLILSLETTLRPESSRLVEPIRRFLPENKLLLPDEKKPELMPVSNKK
ncbi:MAG: S1C family serine protease [Verrucomicrobiota bacterium]